MQNYFFIDSKGKSSASQYTFAFENGLFSPEDIEVIIRFRFRSFLSNIRAWLKYKYKIRFVIRTRENCVSSQCGNVFYFFNSVENIRLLKNRNVNHFFLGHGESNKRASLHPMYRVYDYLLVAGPFASHRLQQYGVMNQETAAQRVLDIGSSGVANIDFDDLRVIGENKLNSEARGLLYMPTWEGGTESENSSTLCFPRLLEFLIESLKINNANFIFFRPHPNIGSRNSKYKDAYFSLLKQLKRENVQIVVGKKGFETLSVWQRALLGVRKMAVEEKSLNFCYALVDVSAAETMAAKLGIPSIILTTDKSDIFAPKAYLELKGSAVIQLDRWSSMQECSEYAKLQTVQTFQGEFISYFREDGNAKLRHVLSGFGMLGKAI
ncbi:hypothetical protein PsAD46_00990 [Pseudovibrio sp. Ad46]|uniref:hypothetical protein n=1 Tax=unclassified Pseudovibrio TaxID=2627060 RepID=UPI0007B212E4|nr:MULTISPECIES: hypothetical protein [unclassified Pseudovibrio]KZK94707.1 hypothetical protein PsAD46_00990 [Pseudovibrio sp. Ad46]KZL01627.1 hypothetical protein PsAD5_00549 [Pseudovibrio sp. Ad5]